VVDDAIRFVSGRSKEKIRSSSDSNEDGSKKESNEPACGEDEELEEKQEEKEVGETVATINQVF
jgi:hypothetical protein